MYSGSVKGPTGSWAADSTAISGGVYGSQTINYYGYDVSITTWEKSAVDPLLLSCTTTGTITVVFQYVFDSPSDPTPTVGQSLGVDGYNLSTDSAALLVVVGGAAVSASGSFTHLFPPNNSWTLSSPYGNPVEAAGEPWPAAAVPTDPTEVVGNSGTLYNYAGGAYTTGPVWESGGVYYATMNYDWSELLNCSVYTTPAAIVHVGNSDTDLIGIALVGGYPVQY